jgi:hypothetical protein
VSMMDNLEYKATEKKTNGRNNNLKLGRIFG